MVILVTIPDTRRTSANSSASSGFLMSDPNVAPLRRSDAPPRTSASAAQGFSAGLRSLGKPARLEVEDVVVRPEGQMVGEG